MKRKKAALYSPYLDLLGGGERYILSILKVLENKGYDITIFWDENLSEHIRNKLNISFKSLIFSPNLFKKKSSHFERTKILSSFDMFLYVTDGSYFFSSAKENFIYAMYPQRSLYKDSFLNRIKQLNYRFITHSVFVQDHLASWGIKSVVIYPYIDKVFIKININELKKEKIILSVGRFFKHLHSKRHDISIKAFKELKETSKLFSGYKLVLAGGLKDEDRNYFKSLQLMAGQDSSISFFPNIEFEKLLTLYKKSLYYWHFAGYGTDEQLHPEKLEHFGISPLEAQAAGCITFCYNAGGPREIIDEGNTGFLFNKKEELYKKITLTANDPQLISKIQTMAKKKVTDEFGYESFKKNVEKIMIK